MFFARANLLAQYYLMEPLWGNIKDLVHVLDGKSVPAQTCVLRQIFALLDSSEVDLNSEPARVKRTDCNKARFHILSSSKFLPILNG